MLRLAAGEVDPASLVQFGVLGVIVALGLFGWIWFKPAVDRLLADKERAENQRDALIEVYQQQVIPVLRETKDHVVPALEEVHRAITELSGAMAEVKEALGHVNRGRSSR